MMIEGQIIHKLKLDIEEKERSYQKELQKIKAENELLAYIKGMLDITEGNVSNFPYYDSNDLDTIEAEEDFNVMLKYTLKEDCIIDSFKAEIKNLYFLEKIGYRHAEQYQETKEHLEEYRRKIEHSYQELISNETLKKATAKKEEILKKLSDLKTSLINENMLEVQDIDSFYEELKYANLSENEKTAILLSVFEKNLSLQKSRLDELENIEQIQNRVILKIALVIPEQELENMKELLRLHKLPFGKLPIKITYPVKTRIIQLQPRTQEIIDIIKNGSNMKKSKVDTPKKFMVEE